MSVRGWSSDMPQSRLKFFPSSYSMDKFRAAMETNNSVRVSVVIPCFNAEKFLPACLGSFLDQSFKDFEIICVDDGSTDNSLSILKSYSGKDERIKVISQGNMGAGPARNEGCRHADGKYILFFDADDIARRSMLLDLVTAAEKNDADLTVCGSLLLDEANQKIKKCGWAVKHDVLPKKECFSKHDADHDFFTMFAWWPWDKLWKTSFLRSTGIVFDSLANTEDLFFCAANALLAERIAVVDRLLVIHRTGVSTSRSETRDDHCCDFIESLLHLRDFMISKSIYGSLERDFINYAVPFSIWNMDTLGGRAFLTVFTRLRESFFPEIKAFGREKGYIRDGLAGKQLEKIYNQDAAEALAERYDGILALAEHYREKRHSKSVWFLKRIVRNLRLFLLRL